MTGIELRVAVIMVMALVGARPTSWAAPLSVSLSSTGELLLEKDVRLTLEFGREN